MVRLRRVRIDAPGWTRRRAGKGFVYLDVERVRITDEEHLERIVGLAIPPAWRDVWISPWPNGHIQAAGLDDAARRQYLYHQQWRRRRDRLKHDHVLDVARRLPAARRHVERDLALPGMPRQKVLALAFRLLDLAYLRVGGEGYAQRHGSYGLATLRKDHVRVLPPESPDDAGRVHLHFPAKSGQVRDTVVEDDTVAELVRVLVRRRDDMDDLLAWRDDDGEWHDVTSVDVGQYVKQRLGGDASAKDFRTWHATVLAARALATAGPPPRSDRARRRVVTQAVKAVAEELGNTPAVCRASYIDPRVVDLWEHGTTIRPTRSQRVAERETLRLLGG
ncbi:DNA topoisomerase IB [Cellulomonas fimi]|uniref:DNA topoisomerase n=1 Tax=Cellulomonas fimi (strain ATCC 484 / DSM 20113 / JCM 1341 / CCUG 24087 / LMG 16345 / NBRC 15513 / NCIMB 8980 / NCTC 7547 / NRS-133) TaxID=590998 RepID=F4H5S5_CELFA|nr:DNA topoisomerase IB [Cellulomonas fimi]AEE45525.1 DNA topoisomerase [Cellulomonas fimi ATCC 484]NNH05963.1 DNA topoisomerase IB [Cellulomonas fimi]VEH29725.1 Eukaryotic DNA topoisomerase I, catalytic core [Cellulomonas fimi]